MKKSNIPVTVPVTIAGAEAVCIRSDRQLPASTLETLAHVIEMMFRKAGTSLTRHTLKGKVIHLGGSTMASIQTHFVYDEVQRGFIFDVCIQLYKTVRMICHHLVSVTNDLVTATFVVKTPAATTA